MKKIVKHYKSALYLWCFTLISVCVYLWPATLQAGTTCSILKEKWKPEIKVVPFYPEPFILYDKTQKEIDSETDESQQRWLEENGLSEVWSTKDMHTLGYAAGALGVYLSGRVWAPPLDRYGTYFCPFFKNLQVDIAYRTLIRIANEFPKDSCEHEVILAHELKHHEANLNSFKKYIEKLESDLPEMVSYFEPPQMHHSKIDKHIVEMGERGMKGLEEALEVYIIEYASQEAYRLNSEIDSPESYAKEFTLIEKCKQKRQEKAQALKE